ncbi:hypothetical protein ABE137_03890 [Brevibacillus laterosporus]|uniref:hypothetical protein n=1 Tax=Brevibacillus laterosporus TaxID=1465 RepID=UPI003D2082D8
MTNVTILTDDNGVNREYREVERSASIGELVRAVETQAPFFREGDIGKFVGGAYNVDFSGQGNAKVEEDGIWHVRSYVVLEPTDIIHVDGVRYREEKREAKAGDRILIVAVDDATGWYTNGSVLTVKEVPEMFSCVRVKEYNWLVYHREYVVITPLDELATNNITVNLTVNVASSSPSEILKAIVDSVQVELAKCVGEPNNEETRDKITEALTNKFRDGVEEQARAGAVRRVLRKTRDNTVERAKADLVELRSDMSNVRNPRLRGRDDIYLLKGRLGMIAEFIVNKEKRAVVCLLRGAVTPERIYARSIAKCSPDDCFNVHIGKAIALRRALGLDVPADYLNAPQPTEVRVGDVVIIVGKQSFHHYYDVGDIGHVKDISNSVGSLKVYSKRTADADRSKDGYYQHVSVTDVEIIDDSRDQETAVIAVA